MFERSWVRILDGHDIFHTDLCKEFYCWFEKRKRPGFAYF